jgi:hypothetical protein
VYIDDLKVGILIPEPSSAALVLCCLLTFCHRKRNGHI